MFGNIVRNLSSTVVKTKTYNYVEMGVMIFAPVVSVLGAVVSYSNYQKVKKSYEQEIENMDRLESLS